MEGRRKFFGMLACVVALTLLGMFDKIDGDTAANFLMAIFGAYVVGNVMADHVMQKIPKAPQ